MSVERRYLDSSALVKLVLREADSAPLADHLHGGPQLASAGLAHVEVVRAVRPWGGEAVQRARALLAEVDILPLEAPLLDAAADLKDVHLRSLDAIHVAAALSLGDHLAELITYDHRMAGAAERLGLPVASPA